MSSLLKINISFDAANELTRLVLIWAKVILLSLKKYIYLWLLDKNGILTFELMLTNLSDWFTLTIYPLIQFFTKKEIIFLILPGSKKIKYNYQKKKENYYNDKIFLFFLIKNNLIVDSLATSKLGRLNITTLVTRSS